MLGKSDPLLADTLASMAAQVVRDCAPGPAKRWARAVGVSRSRASRHRSGDPHSPATRVLEVFYALADSDVATAIPLLREVVSVVYARKFKRMTAPALEAKLRELRTREHTLERDENAATTAWLESQDNPEALAALDRAHALKLDCHLEILMVIRELRARRKS